MSDAAAEKRAVIAAEVARRKEIHARSVAYAEHYAQWCKRRAAYLDEMRAQGIKPSAYAVFQAIGKPPEQPGHDFGLSVSELFPGVTEDDVARAT